MRKSSTTVLGYGGGDTEAIKYSDLLAKLRAIAPLRAATAREAFMVAGLQAARFRELTGTADQFALPTETISGLPRVDVIYVEGLPVSGLSRWSGSVWRIAIADGDALGRQRFTLAHEIKHVIDHGHRRDRPGRMDEQLADFFAASLLMPKRLVVRLWGQGIQDPEVLAEQFEVSPAALAVRLSQLGLRTPARCVAGMVPTTGGEANPERPSLAVSPAPGSEAWT